jgi:ribosomal protein L11 methyltransferase
VLVWRKLASAKWEDAWVERLGFLGPERVAITALAGSRTIRIEAYGLTQKIAARLLKEFGGQTRSIARTATFETRPNKPIVIRQRLVVVESEKDRERLPPTLARRATLIIPAGMAFGTGGHATTSQCLRFLCDAAAEPKRPWEMLDLGTGSGILALAARALGAGRVDAFDFDPDAVRTARENARRNGFSRVAIRRLDVTKWQPRRKWEVVAANLYSEVLIAAAPVIADAVTPGGRLLLSGILRTQEQGCIAAFSSRCMNLQKTARRGKWVTLAWRRMAVSGEARVL